MPPEKIARVDALAASLVAKPMVAVVGIRGVPASALQSMRRELRRRDHPITVATNSTIRHALEKAMHDRPAFGPLLDQVQEPTAVLSASGNPFSLYQEFLRTRSPTPARGGEVAPHDIFVPAGITNFKPGPIVGELQHAGFPAAIEKGKVILKKDTTIVKAGATISREVAGLLTRLEIFPLEVGLTLRAVVDGSTYYPPEVLSVDLEARRGELAREATRALGLAVALAFPTPQSLPRLLGRAHRRALGLALATQYLTKETIEPLFAQAMREAAAVGRLTGH
ncbi:MAG TPA: 50S ribosomal protein L10 [Thermoplasmata archaeon]|nr:50S ribosomal protein L10 [Thermoplasmata archaeon]